jgi:hypothetical protein
MIHKKIINLGSKIDNAYDNRNADLLVKIIQKTEQYRKENLNNDEIAVLDYFVGNAWSGLDTIRNYTENNVWLYERIEKINAIKFFRKCISNNNVSEKTKKNIFIQAYTNLGNLFSESGRIIYAIESWKRALDIFPSFGMAGANLCHGLIYYANTLYDQNHKALLLHQSYDGLMLFLKCKDIYENARIAFDADVQGIKVALDKDFLEKKIEFKNYSLGRSVKEQEYHKWVLKNSLYLNPLNDIFYNSAITHDVLHLPSMITREYTAPIFHGFFNEIKQEFITARYLFYTYKNEIPENKIHYSDKGRNLINTLDYPQYGYRYELLKNSFRSLFSLFDKIAYFINEYFNIGIDKDKVYFRSIWYKNGGINTLFDQMNNNPLRGLYYLSKDFYSKDMDYLEVTDSDAKDMAEIRNHLEHKYLKIHWIKVDEHDKSRFDTLAYSITENDFQDKTFRLLKSAREAIIYLSLAIHVEERKKDTSDGLIMPLPMFRYD